jgi:hypothetical protein
MTINPGTNKYKFGPLGSIEENFDKSGPIKPPGLTAGLLVVLNFFYSSYTYTGNSLLLSYGALHSVHFSSGSSRED